jgi:hypothetical protein
MSAVSLASVPGQLLGQLHLAADQVQGRGVDDAGGQLALDGRPHLGDVVPEHVREDAAEEIQVGPAGRVGDPAAAAADQFQGVLVVQAHPVREHGAMTVEKRHSYQCAPCGRAVRNPSGFGVRAHGFREQRHSGQPDGVFMVVLLASIEGAVS